MRAKLLPLILAGVLFGAFSHNLEAGVWGKIKGAAKKVGGAVKKGAKKVGGAAKKVGKKVGGAAKKVGKKVGGAAQKVGGAARRGAKAVDDFLGDIHFKQTPSTLIKVAKQLPRIGKELVRGGKHIGRQVGGAVKKGAKATGRAVKKAGKGLVTAGKAVGSAGKAVGKGVVKVVTWPLRRIPRIPLPPPTIPRQTLNSRATKAVQIPIIRESKQRFSQGRALPRQTIDGRQQKFQRQLPPRATKPSAGQPRVLTLPLQRRQRGSDKAFNGTGQGGGKRPRRSFPQSNARRILITRGSKQQFSKRRVLPKQTIDGFQRTVQRRTQPRAGSSRVLQRSRMVTRNSFSRVKRSPVRRTPSRRSLQRRPIRRR